MLQFYILGIFIVSSYNSSRVGKAKSFNVLMINFELAVGALMFYYFCASIHKLLDELPKICSLFIKKNQNLG